MRHRLCLCAILLLLFFSAPAPARQALVQAGDTASTLKSLRRQHPRLMATDEDLARIRGHIAHDSLARKWYQQLRREAEKLLSEPTIEYKLIGPRLLAQSKRCLERVYTLGLIYRLDGDRRFAERARQELLAAAAFKDWNPSHFLDVAEMSHAFGIGYDWLYDFLSVEDRATIRAALTDKGLKLALPFYRENKWWVKVTHNWNQVCNGGMVIGALAVADETPELSASIISRALESVRLPMGSYAPDGGWNEGPGYWHYATSYNVCLLAALESALGPDFAPLQSLRQMPGFAVTGDFRIYSTGPLGRPFNYADAHDRREAAPEMFWLARAFNQPRLAWHQRMMRSQIGGRPSAFDLLWFEAQGEGPKKDAMPLDAVYRGIDVAFFRSAWEDTNAWFIGFKGGDNQANHSHLDLGSFVLDAQGYRWAADLGSDDYNLPGYFDKKQRWNYYRLKTAGHNTLLIDGADQSPTARAPLIAFYSRPERAFAIADLTAAYPALRRVWRGVALLDRQRVLIEDELEADTPHEVIWQLHTPAEISISGATATLRQGETIMQARIIAPASAHFETASAAPSSPAENQNRGISKLIARLPEKVRATRLVIMIESPDRKMTPPKIEPLARWQSLSRK